MAWVNKGDFFEVNGVHFVALENSYSTWIFMEEDSGTFDAGYNMNIINEVVYAAPMKDGNVKAPYHINLHRARNVKVVEKVNT